MKYELTDVEWKMIKEIRDYFKTTDYFVLMNPKNNRGYNPITGKCIILQEVEIDDKC